MKSPHFLQCHQRRCRTCCRHTAEPTWPPEEKPPSGEDQEQNDHLARSISKSITHRLCVDKAAANEDDEKGEVDCKVTTVLQRIWRQFIQQSLFSVKKNGPWNLYPWRVLFLSLVLLLSSQPAVVNGTFQHSTSLAHQNHSSTNALPFNSSLALEASTNLAPITLLEGLLEEPSLEEAIRRLTDAWNDAHSGEGEQKRGMHQNPMISSKQVKLEEKNVFVGEEGHIRSKRSHQHQSVPPAQSIHPSSSNTASNCTRCRLKEEARSLRIETIKFNILARLGLDRPPNISRHSLPPIPPLDGDLLLRQYQMHQGNEARTIKVASANSHQKRHAAGGFGPVQQDYYGAEYADDYYVNPQKSFVFAQSRKLTFFF